MTYESLAFRPEMEERTLLCSNPYGSTSFSSRNAGDTTGHSGKPFASWPRNYF